MGVRARGLSRDFGGLGVWGLGVRGWGLRVDSREAETKGSLSFEVCLVGLKVATLHFKDHGT